MEDEDIYNFYDDNKSKVCSLSRKDAQKDMDLLKNASTDSQYFCPERKRTAKRASMLCLSVFL